MQLHDYQLEALNRMSNGCILNGGVGSGKSRTALAYYYIHQGGSIENGRIEPLPDGEFDFGDGKFVMRPKDLYIITTARKRDTHEWESELSSFLLSASSKTNTYSHKIVIDSWNNIKKYSEVKNAFFIFDEQRVTGKGPWVKAFLSITKSNEWIMLSATPGDSFLDYVPVFIANGYFKNRTQFMREHVAMAPQTAYRRYPVIDRYLNTRKLMRLRERVLIQMDYQRPTQLHHETVNVDYDILGYKTVVRNRWSLSKNEPIINASEFCTELRRIVNSHPSRVNAVMNIIHDHPRVIIFYNYDYELEILKNLPIDKDVAVAEWNGHVHQPIPETNKWIYLVNYMAGAEGWNCTSTNTIIFFSQTYSYKTVIQAAGRIDRLNTPYRDLYYYHLKSKAPIDIAISRTLARKKDFNAGKFISNMFA